MKNFMSKNNQTVPVAQEVQSPVANDYNNDAGSEIGVVAEVHLKRNLKSRHLQMIAIGGTIGTGLFISSGTALATSGPAGALIAYAFIGTLVYSVMVALGEMAAFLPVTGAFTAYSRRFCDPSLSFAMGWIYWFSWAITYALELTASGLIIQYWAPDLNIGIFIGVFWAVITILNFFPVSIYGEIEFYFAMIKVVTVLGFMIFGICINAGAGKSGYLGFTYWRNPGAFAEYIVTDNPALAKFVGFWAVLIQAGFSYQGTELVGIAAGEAQNPRKTIPSAIRKTFFRILFFFVLSIFFIGILVPYDNGSLLNGTTDAASSPFVIAAELAGVQVLPDIINAILITVVLSAANSNVYSGSRILAGLSEGGQAPAFFKKTTEKGVPYFCVAFTAAFGLLGFLNLSAGSSQAFNWFLNITAVAGFICWAIINVSHIAFMRALKAQGISRDSLPYKAFAQPWLSYYGLFFNVLIILTQGFTSFMPWDTRSFFVAYISLIIFVALYIGHKIVFRQPFVKAAEADLLTGRKDLDAAEEDFQYDEKKPTHWFRRVLA